MIVGEIDPLRVEDKNAPLGNQVCDALKSVTANSATDWMMVSPFDTFAAAISSDASGASHQASSSSCSSGSHLRQSLSNTHAGGGSQAAGASLVDSFQVVATPGIFGDPDAFPGASCASQEDGDSIFASLLQ